MSNDDNEGQTGAINGANQPYLASKTHDNRKKATCPPRVIIEGIMWTA